MQTITYTYLTSEYEKTRTYIYENMSICADMLDQAMDADDYDAQTLLNKYLDALRAASSALPPCGLGVVETISVTCSDLDVLARLNLRYEEAKSRYIAIQLTDLSRKE
jgi:hypothetical protein